MSEHNFAQRIIASTVEAAAPKNAELAAPTVKAVSSVFGKPNYEGKRVGAYLWSWEFGDHSFRFGVQVILGTAKANMNEVSLILIGSANGKTTFQFPRSFGGAITAPDGSANPAHALGAKLHHVAQAAMYKNGHEQASPEEMKKAEGYIKKLVSALT